jgi:hypothetical protein
MKTLSPKDYFGLVVFDNGADEIIAYNPIASEAGNYIAKINQLYARGGTDILNGLNKGLDGMSKMVSSAMAQTLVILTDGNTNIGVTDQEEIIKKIKTKTGANIRITTMGIGIDLRHDLLRDISYKTNGQFHYIERDQDIEKVCIREFASVAFPIGKNAVISFEIPEYIKVKNVYGTSEKIGTMQKFNIPIMAINYSLTQVIILDIEYNPNYNLSLDGIKISLSYTSLPSDKTVALSSPVRLIDDLKSGAANDMLKNFLIAEWAYSIREMSEAYHQKNNETQLKQNVLHALGNPLVTYAPLMNDEDIDRLKKLFENLTTIL